ncbi:MAG TPA: class I SAM-dependent methyltransferase [Stellaceae bacterium]|nr:class I SAM-dependent methyltransferase [Stellaceae bacterium]
MVATTERPIGEHEWHSADYVDWWIARDLSRDAERRLRLREMLSHTGFATDAEFSVLDVGGGYGVVSEEVLAAFPRARVTLQDYSEPMLGEARRRLAAHRERTAFVLADLTDPAWTGRVGGPFDLAVSAIVIHNLRDLSLIASSYRGVAQVLKQGGLFLDYDLFFDNIGGLERHTELLKAAGFAEVRCLWQQLPLATVAARTAAV